MRVAIDGVFLGAGRGGDETFLRGVLRGLALRRAPDDEFPLILPHGYSPPEAENDPAFPVVRLPVRPGPWHFGSALPKVLRQLRPDLALTITHAALTGRVGSAVTIGDLSFVHRPQEYPRGTAARLRALVPVHARRARVVVVPSEYTRQDVIDCYGMEPDRCAWCRTGSSRPTICRRRTGKCGRVDRRQGVAPDTCSTWAISTHGRTCRA